VVSPRIKQSLAQITPIEDGKATPADGHLDSRGFHNASIGSGIAHTMRRAEVRKPVFVGNPKVELVGIEPTTSCLQIRTTRSSAVATDDHTGESGDDDPDLAPPFVVVCAKCLPPQPMPQTPLGFRAGVVPYRPRKPVTGFSPHEGSNPSLSVISPDAQQRSGTPVLGVSVSTEAWLSPVARLALRRPDPGRYPAGRDAAGVRGERQQRGEGGPLAAAGLARRRPLRSRIDLAGAR
jgi:hypothetical protein